MPVQVEQTRPRGIRFPPNGWTLVVLLALYIFTGLIGHDPWKNDDALTIGVIHEMVATGNWLMPGLAGQPYPDDPLYYWVGASSSSLLSWLLPIHDAARLASGKITFEQVGRELPNEVVRIPYQKATLENNVLKGTIAILDIQYGNIWTNIPVELFKQLDVKAGDKLTVTVYHNKQKIYSGIMPYCTTFGSVPEGKPLLYLNSLMQVAFALNMGNFSLQHKIYSGSEWTVEVKKVQGKN